MPTGRHHEIYLSDPRRTEPTRLRTILRQPVEVAGPARPLAVIGAATSAGAYGPGHEMAPAVLRRYGLLEALRSGGRAVRDVGDVVSVRHRPDEDHPDAANVGLVVAAVRRVATSVAESLARGEEALVVGGDCTVELGTVAGALADGASVGLVYVDLDGDLNTPATGDGVLDCMGLAHLLGLPGTVAELAEVGPRVPMLSADAVQLVAADNLTAPERAVVDRLGVGSTSLATVQDDVEGAVDGLRGWAARFDRVLVHVDIDVPHYPSFPIAHEIRDAPGLTIDELDELLARLRRLPGWTALTICEINPDHATDEAVQLPRLVSLLERAVLPRRGRSAGPRPAR